MYCHHFLVLTKKIWMQVLSFWAFLKNATKIHWSLCHIVNLPNFVMKPAVISIVKLSMFKNPCFELLLCHSEYQNIYLCVFLLMFISLNILYANLLTRWWKLFVFISTIFPSFYTLNVVYSDYLPRKFFKIFLPTIDPYDDRYSPIDIIDDVRPAYPV